MTNDNYTITPPAGWHRLEEFCYPGNNSKAYKSNTTRANIHVVNMHDTGIYTVNGENKNGDTFSQKIRGYKRALRCARRRMECFE